MVEVVRDHDVIPQRAAPRRCLHVPQHPAFRVTIFTVFTTYVSTLTTPMIVSTTPVSVFTTFYYTCERHYYTRERLYYTLG